MQTVELKSHNIRGIADGPHLLITAGVHGDEFEGIAAIHRLIREIDAKKLRGRISLVPIVNESAFASRSRCGTDGLDLARNCPGDFAGSVTQQAAAALTKLIQSADLYIDLHSGGVAMEVYPLAGYMLVESEQVLKIQQRMARAFGLPLVWGTSDELDGRSTSVARDAQVPAIYVEYLGAGRCDPAGVAALFSGCLNVISEFGMLNTGSDEDTDERQADVSAEPSVHENHKPGSGHMQVCNSAPSTGLFEPAVRLGQHVQTGATLGMLSDWFTGKSCEYAASESGAVIVLRTYPRVEQGDSLAVILEDADELPPIEVLSEETEPSALASGEPT